MSGLSEEKLAWLKSIGAKEYPEPVKYIYGFKGYAGAFNLSEQYISEHTVEELQADYLKCQAHALKVINADEARKALDNQIPCVEQTEKDHFPQSISPFPRFQCGDAQGSQNPVLMPELRAGRGETGREVIEIDTEKEVLNAIISYRNENGEVTDTLKMTQEEYDQIISRFSNAHRTVKKNTSVHERIAVAKAAAPSGEILKSEHFGCSDSDGFIKTLYLINAWSGRLINMMQEYKSFRFVVDYDREALKTDYYFYTPDERTE